MTQAARATPLDKEALAARVARDIRPGSFVNLGIGLPTLVAEFLAREAGVTLHTENGMLGMGPAAVGDEYDPDLINAGKIAVTELPGAAYFNQAESFAMMRGGHIDVCVMGAFEVSAGGDLANWSTGAPDAIPAVGGAMDLAVGARSTWVMMNLFTKSGEPKLVQRCALPLAGVACVSRVYSDYAVIDVGAEGVRSEGVGAGGVGAAAAPPRVLETFGISTSELADRLGLALDDRT
jgi:3-oxoadipate CoA-transferase beta subunit